MADFATTSDLEGFWRVLSAAERTRAVALLGYAASLIRAEWPDIDARLAAGFDSTLPKFVSVTMVKRAMIAGEGEGIAQDTRTAGPFSTSQSFTNPMGSLYLTGEERRMLSPTGTRRRAFTINPTPAAVASKLPWWDRQPPQ